MAGVSYRGLDPDTRVARWIAFLVIAAVTVIIFGGVAFQAVSDWLTIEQDRLAWYGIRLLGILSWAALTGSVIYGLLLSTGILDAIAHRTVSFALHQELSAIGLGLAVVHAALLSLDSTVPFSLGELVVPFAAPYRPEWVGLGQLGLYLTVIIVASFSVRKRIGQRTWRRLHYLTFLIALATTAHGLMAGTDSGAPFALPMYASATVAMVSLVAYRIYLAMTVHRRPSGVTAPVTGQPRLTVIESRPPTGRPRRAPLEAPAGYVRPGAVSADPPAGYQQPGAGYGQPGAGYVQPGAAYGDPSMGYVRPGAAYGDPSMGYVQPGAAYGDPSMGYADPRVVSRAPR